MRISGRVTSRIWHCTCCRMRRNKIGYAGVVDETEWHYPVHAGFELGIKGMQPGGKRRIVVPPELGPPVGPSTFFSAKQCEVFDVQLRDVKSCRRRQVAMFSDVVCE